MANNILSVTNPIKEGRRVWFLLTWDLDNHVKNKSKLINFS